MGGEDQPQYRAIMTTRDRGRIAAEDLDDMSKKYESVSRVRSRIEALETDVGILAEHHPQLLRELREVVCDGE